MTASWQCQTLHVLSGSIAVQARVYGRNRQEGQLGIEPT